MNDLNSDFGDAEFQAAYFDGNHPQHQQAVDSMLAKNSVETTNPEDDVPDPHDPVVQASDAPERPALYELGNLTGQVENDPDTADAVAQMFHSGGVPSWVGQVMYAEGLNVSELPSDEQIAQEGENTIAKLSDEWGEAELNRVLTQAQEVVQKMGPQAEQMLDVSGLGNNERIIRTFKNWLDTRA